MNGSLPLTPSVSSSLSSDLGESEAQEDQHEFVDYSWSHTNSSLPHGVETLPIWSAPSSPTPSDTLLHPPLSEVPPPSEVSNVESEADMNEVKE